MFDHIGFPVSNLPHSKRFYQTALEPLGVAIIMELTAEQTGSSSQAGFGENGKPYFWIGDAEGVVRGRLHIAFTAKTRADVDAFYNARWRPAAATTASPDCGRTITRITTGRSCSIRTATISKPSAIRPRPEDFLDADYADITDERGLRAN